VEIKDLETLEKYVKLISPLLAEATKNFAIRERRFTPMEATIAVGHVIDVLDRPDFLRKILQRGGRIFVANYGNRKCLGFAALSEVSKEELGQHLEIPERYLEQIAVSKEFKNVPIGLKLMLEISKACKTEGVAVCIGTSKTGFRSYSGKRRVRPKPKEIPKTKPR